MSTVGAGFAAVSEGLVGCDFGSVVVGLETGGSGWSTVVSPDNSRKISATYTSRASSLGKIKENIKFNK